MTQPKNSISPSTDIRKFPGNSQMLGNILAHSFECKSCHIRGKGVRSRGWGLPCKTTLKRRTKGKFQQRSSSSIAFRKKRDLTVLVMGRVSCNSGVNFITTTNSPVTPLLQFGIIYKGDVIPLVLILLRMVFLVITFTFYPDEGLSN